ncbi:MAG: GBS Bsp-like repeat-containing protein, partial [Oscillibacter sp.]|nr:GBS Bsp-like repeat-containing protein [Oscillibacter sp.]
GTYFIHAYGNSKQNLVAHTTAYVEKIPGPEMKAAVSADGRYLDVTLTGRSDLSRVWFPTWSQDNGQDDLRWYEAVKQTDGSWTCRVPLSNHGSTGTYFIHAYGNDKKNLVAHTTAYVEKLVQPEKPAMTAVLSADGRYLDVTLTGRGDLSRVWFPTWSAVNGQDDLRWYEAVKQADGSWTCRVPLANHKNAGGYFLHAYGNDKRNLVAHTTVSVAQAVSPQVWTQLSADGRYMTVTLTGRSDLSRVWFPVWSAVNGQDDLQWYEAKKQSNGDWTYTVTLARHKGAGTYFIHVYGNSKQNLVAHTTAYVI